MIYDDSHCDTYEEYCEEILAYMRCQNESFDFGEGLIGMTDGGEYGMYKIAILPYLNSFYETDFEIWRKAKQVDKLHRRIEAGFDELSNDKLNQRLFNKYDRNMKWKRRRRKYKVSETICPTYEVKLNSEYVDEIEFDQLNQDKIILQQFKGEEDTVYLCLNNQQVKVDLRDIKMSIDMFYDTYVNTLK